MQGLPAILGLPAGAGPDDEDGEASLLRALGMAVDPFPLAPDGNTIPEEDELEKQTAAALAGLDSWAHHRGRWDGADVDARLGMLEELAAPQSMARLAFLIEEAVEDRQAQPRRADIAIWPRRDPPKPEDIPLPHDRVLIDEAGRGNTETVRHLLTWEESQADPSRHGGEALLRAVENGHYGVVEELLGDSRMDPTVCRRSGGRGRHSLDDLLDLANREGHSAVFDLLLQDGRCEVRRGGMRTESLEIAEMLLADGRMDPKIAIWQVLTIAAGQGDLLRVEGLLEDPRMEDPRGSQALIVAIENGHAPVVARLLQERGRELDPLAPLQPSAVQNLGEPSEEGAEGVCPHLRPAILTAALRGHTAVLELFMEDGGGALLDSDIRATFAGGVRLAGQAAAAEIFEGPATSVPTVARRRARATAAAAPRPPCGANATSAPPRTRRTTRRRSNRRGSPGRDGPRL